MSRGPHLLWALAYIMGMPACHWTTACLCAFQYQKPLPAPGQGGSP